MLKDAPVNAMLRPNFQGKTPFHVAAELEDTRFLEQLLGKILKRNHVGRTIDRLQDKEANCKHIKRGEEAAGGEAEKEERDKELKGENAQKFGEVGDIETFAKNKEENEGAVEENDEDKVESEEDEQNIEEDAFDRIVIKDSRGRTPIFNTCEKFNLPEETRVLVNRGDGSAMISQAGIAIWMQNKVIDWKVIDIKSTNTLEPEE